MIVRPDASSLLLITQPDHARLAGRLMEAWRADGLPARPTRGRVLHATAAHDTGWEEEDAAPFLDAGTGLPCDFVAAPVHVRQRIWPRAVRKLAAEDGYVAALVAQHALTVYRRYGGDPEWTDFFDTLEALRDDLYSAWMASATADRRGNAAADGAHSFLQDYAIVGLGDLLSLTFCNGWTEPQAREGYRAILQGDVLTIEPDPFDGASVRLDVRARRLPRRRYGSDAEVADAWVRAPVEVVAGQAVGAPLAPIS
jgi:hypothetical protein